MRISDWSSDVCSSDLNSGLCLDKPVDRVRALEAMSFIMAAKAVSFSSLERTESRGAHWRDDYPIRKDDNWMCHVSVRKTQAGEFEIGRCNIDRSEEHTSELQSLMRL